MDYCTTREISEMWNISDRRVRTLCREGRIPGVIESAGSYLIPADAVKPTDKRRRTLDYFAQNPRSAMHVADPEYAISSNNIIMYLKWEDDVIARIDDTYNVLFERPDYNTVVSRYTAGNSRWSREEFERFLQERIVSRTRRDVEKILFRCGLSSYDVIKVGIATHAMNAGDLLWITDDPDMRMQDAMTDVFGSIFLQRIDAEGDSIDTPDGYNIKRYGVYKGEYGIYKKRLSPVTSDAESEVAVYHLAELMGVPCCRAYRTDNDTVFSVFEYDFAHEYIIHMRRLFENLSQEGQLRSDNEYLNLISVRPQYQTDFIRMIALDFVTRQDDRHLSNIALKVTSKGESFYPLYDNGRSLFYEDSEETAARACGNIELYSTSFGPSGTYYDYVREIAAGGIDFSKLVNLNIDDDTVRRVLTEAGIKGYRLEASCTWISETLAILRSL